MVQSKRAKGVVDDGTSTVLDKIVTPSLCNINPPSTLRSPQESQTPPLTVGTSTKNVAVGAQPATHRTTASHKLATTDNQNNRNLAPGTLGNQQKLNTQHLTIMKISHSQKPDFSNQK